MEQPKLEAVLPLSPLQEGMLFHAGYQAGEVDAYTVQMAFDLRGPLDAERMHKACQAVVDRHQGLRAAFLNRRDGKVVQAISGPVAVPWRLADVSDASGAAQSRLIGRLLAGERARRFDTSVAPLIRFTLVRRAPDRHVLALSCHHILLDGWSLGLVLGELFLLYGDRGDELPPPVSVSGYLTWLAGRDRDAAREAWREALADLEQPTLLAGGTAGAAGLPDAIVHFLSEEGTAGLVSFARGRGLTLSSCVQAAWGLLLASLSGRGDVVFGTTVAVRPGEVVGVEAMVGLLINTVPTRVRVRSSEGFGDLVARVQREQAALADYQYLALSDIHRAAGRPVLFDTSTVFQNYPGAGSEAEQDFAGLRIAAFSGHDTYHYVLKLTTIPGRRLRFELSYRTDAFSAEAANRIADDLVALAAAAPTGGPTPVTPEPDRIDAMRALFADVLGVDDVAAGDDFFALGADSVAALVLAGRIAAETGVAADVRTVFRHATPARLAAHLFAR